MFLFEISISLLRKTSWDQSNVKLKSYSQYYQALAPKKSFVLRFRSWESLHFLYCWFLYFLSILETLHWFSIRFIAAGHVWRAWSLHFSRLSPAVRVPPTTHLPHLTNKYQDQGFVKRITFDLSTGMIMGLKTFKYLIKLPGTTNFVLTHYFSISVQMFTSFGRFRIIYSS